MRRLIHPAVAPVLLLIGVLFTGACSSEYHVKVTIAPDGSAEVSAEAAMTRQLAEQSIAMYSRSRGATQFSTWDSFDAQSKQDKPTAVDDSDPDAKLKSKLRNALQVQVNAHGRAYGRSSPVAYDGKRPQTTIGTIKIEDDVVRVPMTTRYDDATQFVNGISQAMPSLALDRARLEKTDEGKLRLILSPTKAGGTNVAAANMQRYQRMMMKSSGYKGSVAVVMPGKIVSSTLPQSEGNSTTITIDAADSKSLDAAIDLIGKKIEIVSEPGGFDVASLPIETGGDEGPVDAAFADILDNSDPSNALAGVPITDAGPGFRAEAISVTTTSIHYFPEARKRLGQAMRYLAEGQNGCVVHVRVYAPAARIVHSTRHTKLTAAVDDQDRPIKSASDREGDHFMTSYFGNASGEGDGSRAADLRLRLQLPKPDAEAIEKLTGEVVMATFAGWQQQVIAKPKADRSTRIKIDDALRGATLTVLDLKSQSEDQGGLRSQEGTMAVELRGSADVRTLEVMVSVAGTGRMSGDSHNMFDETREIDGAHVRRISLQYSAWQRRQSGEQPLSITVRRPRDLKQERVKFNVTAIDLF